MKPRLQTNCPAIRRRGALRCVQCWRSNAAARCRPSTICRWSGLRPLSAIRASQWAATSASISRCGRRLPPISNAAGSTARPRATRLPRRICASPRRSTGKSRWRCACALPTGPSARPCWTMTTRAKARSPTSTSQAVSRSIPPRRSCSRWGSRTCRAAASPMPRAIHSQSALRPRRRWSNSPRASGLSRRARARACR